MPWPPRSSDIAQMYFFLCGHIKALIYTSPVDSEGDLIVRIVEAAAAIRVQPGIFERTRQSLLSLCRLVSLSVVVRLNICSKFVKKIQLFSEYFRSFVWFSNLVRSTVMVRSTSTTHLQYIVPWQWIFVLVSLITSRNLDMGFFRTLYKRRRLDLNTNQYRNNVVAQVQLQEAKLTGARVPGEQIIYLNM